MESNTWERRRFEDTGSSTDEFETQLEFSRNEEGKMSLAGRMVIGGYKARKFEGVKIGQQPQPTGTVKTIINWWNSLRDPYEESREDLSRTCNGAMDDSSEAETDPTPEIDWGARRKERGAEEAREAEQESYPWPTDMTGEWKITSRGLGSDETASSSMNIYYEDRKATAGRRQYYADFRIGSDWHGTMRFCPVGKLDTDKNEISMDEFEKVCVLKEDVKGGPPPHGIHQWLLK